ncbi:MAG: BrnA antitoxin family protein [Gemmatimonadales bacterium]|nr:BrnA antitoxin family protein [Gemmatimonadales bacterium]
MRKEYDLSGGRRGPVVPVAKGKTRITIRLDDEVLDWFRARVEAAGGGNYQTLINDTLRQLVGSEREPLETVVRRVVRDELRRQPARRRAGRRVAAA